MLGLVLSLASCLVPGDFNQLGFRFRADDHLFGSAHARQPIAAGTSVDLQIFRSGKRIVGRTTPPSNEKTSALRASRVEASSSNGEIATVQVVDDTTLRVSTWAPGTTVLSARVHLEGETRVVSDQISIEVAAVAKAELSHWTHEPRQGATGLLKNVLFGPPAVFLEGGKSRFWIGAFDDNGRALLGFGGELPIKADPERAILFRANSSDLGHIEIEFREAGQVRFQPRGGPSQVVEVAALRSIRGIVLEGYYPSWPDSLEVLAHQETSSPQTIPAGKNMFGWLRAQRENHPDTILLGVKPEIRSTTPEICNTIDPEQEKAAERWLGDSWVMLHALKEGECRFEVSAAGHTTQGAVHVGPAQPE